DHAASSSTPCCPVQGDGAVDGGRLRATPQDAARRIAIARRGGVAGACRNRPGPPGGNAVRRRIRRSSPAGRSSGLIGALRRRMSARMKEPKASAPAVTPKGDREKQARIEREAAALRENLRKRK